MNITLLHGENAYFSKEKLKKITSRFKKSFGEDSVVYVSGDECLAEDIFAELESISMFCPSKLIVVKYFCKSKESKRFVEIYEKKNFANLDGVQLLFWENASADKRSSFYKFIKNNFEVEEFKNLSEGELSRWIVDEFKSRNRNISSDAVTRFIEKVGEEVWRAVEEINKLCLYRLEGDITLSDIEACVSNSASMEVWSLTGAIVGSNKRKALVSLERLINEGTDIHQIWGLIIWQFRQMILISYEKAKRLSPSEIAAVLKMSPFVVKRTLSSPGIMNFTKLKDIYDKLVDIDFQIKIGETEPNLAITLFLSSI